MNVRYLWFLQFGLFMLFLISCSDNTHSETDLVRDPFHGAQAELTAVVESIRTDIMSANIVGLQSIHLESDKFTKFGPRNFYRQDVKSTNESEALFFSSVSNVNYEIKELKIDVFGNLGIVTYYPHVSFAKDGKQNMLTGRQTFVFLKTDNGWKIVHEHGTIQTNDNPKQK